MDDPFTVLGLPRRYDLDRAAVERAYLARAAQLHPDLVGDDEEVAVNAAILNRAKRTLLNDEFRADALLRVLGGPDKEHDKSLPDGFLMEIMETREAVEAALAGEPAERVRWQQWAEEQRGDYRARISVLFTQGTDEVNRKSIRTQLNAWRYIERLIEQLDPRYSPSQSELDA